MQKSTYVIVRVEVLVKKFAAYVEFCVSSEWYTTITMIILGTLKKLANIEAKYVHV